MKHRLSRRLVLVVMLTWATSIAVEAVVAFDFQNNLGFVDRAAIQAAFGLNNGQMQKRAGQVVFSAVQTSTFAVNCASGAVLEAVSEISGTVDVTLVPTKGSFDGFALSGLHDVLISDPPPAEEICGGPGSRGAQTGVVRRLSASLGGQSVVLIEEH